MLSELEPCRMPSRDRSLAVAGPDLGPSLATGGRFDPYAPLRIYQNNTFAR